MKELVERKENYVHRVGMYEVSAGGVRNLLEGLSQKKAESLVFK